MAIEAKSNGYDSLHLYLREIGNHQTLSAAEESGLARRIRAGEQRAREQLILSNLKLVVHIARDFEGLGLPLTDLVSEGNLGLMKAIERFDPERGTRLSTYATYYIKLAMRLALSNQSRVIRLPVSAGALLMALRRAQNDLRHILERDPSEEEVASHVRLPVKKVKRCLRAAVQPVSLDATIDENGSTLGETLADETTARPGDAVMENRVFELVRETLLTLPAREQNVLLERFGFNNGHEKTLDEVGAVFKMTKEGVRRLQNRGLKKLRLRLKANYGLTAH
jgi:RNA polymerase primary sigma factor